MSTPETVGRSAHLKKTAAKLLLRLLVVANVVIALPGIGFAVVLGEYTPAIVIVALSLLAWAACYGITRVMRGNGTTAERQRNK